MWIRRYPYLISENQVIIYFSIENHGDVEWKNDEVFAILEPILHVLKNEKFGNYIDILLLWCQTYSKILAF